MQDFGDPGDAARTGNWPVRFALGAALFGAVLTSVPASAHAQPAPARSFETRPAAPAQLAARPRPVADAPAPGTRSLPGGGIAYVPATIAQGQPTPLLLLLPGTGGTARQMIDAVRAEADRHGIVLLALAAGGENWDAVDHFFDAYEAGSAEGRTRWPTPRFGRDVRRIDTALATLFALVAVDPDRIGVLGYSHGASYALGLGAANPRLFSTIIALSPGILLLPPQPAGGQIVYIAHGTRDEVQPYARSRDVFAPRLAELGFRVTFQPFDGGHILPLGIVAAGVARFLAPPAQ